MQTMLSKRHLNATAATAVDEELKCLLVMFFRIEDLKNRVQDLQNENQILKKRYEIHAYTCFFPNH